MLWMSIRSVGMGLSTMPIMTAAMASISTEAAGRASAMNNILQRVASALGLGVLTAILTGQQAQQMSDRAVLLPSVAPGFPQLQGMAAQGQVGVLQLYNSTTLQVFGAAVSDSLPAHRRAHRGRRASRPRAAEPPGGVRGGPERGARAVMGRPTSSSRTACPGAQSGAAYNRRGRGRACDLTGLRAVGDVEIRRPPAWAAPRVLALSACGTVERARQPSSSRSAGESPVMENRWLQSVGSLCAMPTDAAASPAMRGTSATAMSSSRRRLEALTASRAV
jgi:hypothetical protein